jgi:hypothetical protein
MVYELWDIETGNAIGSFRTEAEALLIVRELLESNGADYADALDLGWLDERGNAGSIATGSSLRHRATAFRQETNPVVLSGRDRS